MNRVIRRKNEISISMDEKKILALMDCSEENPMFFELSEEIKLLEKDVKKVLTPFVCIIECSILGLGEGYAVLLSLGKEISSFCGQLLQQDMIKGMLVNCMADQVLFQMDDQMQKELITIAKKEGFGIKCRKEALSDFSIEYQRVLLELFGEDIPVTMTSGYVLDPEKSMILFFEKSEETDSFQTKHDCRKCKKTNCSYAKCIDEGKE